MATASGATPATTDEDRRVLWEPAHGHSLDENRSTEAAPGMERARLEAELVNHHEDAWGWASSCCLWDRQAAGDVLQDAYLRVLDGRARYDGRAAFRTWLFGVIRRVALERRRSDGRRSARFPSLDRAPPPGSGAGVAPGPVERIDVEQRVRRLREGLERLPGRQREVLHLVFYQEMTIAQAAEVMGVGVGTARTHYERGKQALRARLDALREV